MNLSVRNPSLYPAELRGWELWNSAKRFGGLHSRKVVHLALSPVAEEHVRQSYQERREAKGNFKIDLQRL